MMEQEEIAKAYKEVMDDMNKLNPDKIKGFIVLVDGGEPSEEGKSSTGVNAVCGSCSRILNLLANMDQQPLTLYMAMRMMEND